jgi:uncharacterized lipoprotein YbaY
MQARLKTGLGNPVFTKAHARVRIVNLSGQLRPREIIAEQTTSIEGHGPIRFEINYDRSRIDGGDVYGIEATICVDGKPVHSGNPQAELACCAFDASCGAS